MPSRSFDRHERLPPPELRAKLLAFAAEFVGLARVLAGVERIALLGSILTPKPYPKDVDLLITVSDDCDLAPLARLSRRLQGRSQSLNHGADVFLASPGGRYLGRTCSWRECRPGLRASCDANTCGARAFLHDDLGTVSLPDHLIREPPLELHPRVVSRIQLPDDVRDLILDVRA